MDLENPFATPLDKLPGIRPSNRHRGGFWDGNWISFALLSPFLLLLGARASRHIGRVHDGRSKGCGLQSVHDGRASSREWRLSRPYVRTSFDQRLRLEMGRTKAHLLGSMLGHLYCGRGVHRWIPNVTFSAVTPFHGWRVERGAGCRLTIGRGLARTPWRGKMAERGTGGLESRFSRSERCHRLMFGSRSSG